MTPETALEIMFTCSTLYPYPTCALDFCMVPYVPNFLLYCCAGRTYEGMVMVKLLLKCLIYGSDFIPFILRSPVQYTLQQSDSVRVFDNAALYQSTEQ